MTNPNNAFAFQRMIYGHKGVYSNVNLGTKFAVTACHASLKHQ